MAKLPFNEQLKRVRSRIEYLVLEGVRTRKLGLYEVFGPVGDHTFGPDAGQFDQREVIRQLAAQGEIKILSEDSTNIIFS